LRDVELERAEQSGFEFDWLKLELKSTITEKDSTEDKMLKQIDFLRQLHSHAMEELRNRDGRITLPEKELLEPREKISETSTKSLLNTNVLIVCWMLNIW
jgi:hypothetical protein